MKHNQTACPKCGNIFDAGEALQRHLEEEFQQRIKQQQLDNQRLIEEVKQKLDVEKKQERELFELEEKKRLWAIAQQKAEEKNTVELKALREENERKQQQILAGQQKELALMRKEAELKNLHDELRMQLEKDMILKRQEIEEATKKKAEENFELIKKQYEKQLEDQVKLVDEMKRKAEQGSMQMQGEVQELVLEELLRSAFSFDEINEVGKGIRGADVIQTVRNSFGQECGKIIYESKRTQNFGGDWIDKLKDDQRQIGAEIAVLVTQTMPKDMDRFGQREGVWVCNFQEMKSLVFVLREILIRTQSVKTSQENKTDKMGLLYTYLTGSQFRQQIEAIVEGFSSLKEELDREKRSMQRIWKEREAQIEKVIGNTIDMYGSIKGIAGKAIAPIQYLELPEGEEEFKKLEM